MRDEATRRAARERQRLHRDRQRELIDSLLSVVEFLWWKDETRGVVVKAIADVDRENGGRLFRAFIECESHIRLDDAASIDTASKERREAP